ncbi:MAG TPA: alpha/beta fold hydrolase, partial [Dehalococcoidia bacterium]|nr:alpha/beta fold hydrolase [Dehalococcoidia bacterium]
VQLSSTNLEEAVRAIYETPVLRGARIVPGSEQVVFLANIDETHQAYRWDLETGEYSQLTNEHDPVAQAVPDPAGKRLAILRDEAGNELYNLTLLDLEASKPVETALTDGPLGRVAITDWYPGSNSLLLSGNDDKDNFLARFDIETRALTKLFTSERWLEGGVDLSEDGRWIALSVSRDADDPEDHEIAVFPADAPSEIRWITTGKGRRDEHPRWSPDGSLLAFTSEFADDTHLVIYNSSDLSEVARLELTGEVLSLCYWSPSGDWLDLLLEHQGRNRLFRAHLDDRQLRLEERPWQGGSIEAARRKGDRVAVTFSAVNRPQTATAVLDLEGRRVAELDIFQLDLELASAESIWLESADGTPIQAWLLRGKDVSGPQPGLVYVHGGPTSATKDAWRRDLQSLVLAGFTVLAPNYRGSTGFGPEFRKANINDLGGKDLEDCLAAAEWLRNSPDIDPSRIAIMGGSYGGYMTLWAMVKAPGAFACGAGTVPVTDWVQDYELADASFRYFDVYFFGGTPEEKPELYRDRSPITFVQDLAAPLFISAGRNDSRCPFPPIEEFVEKGWELGKEIEFDVQEAEGHGAGRKRTAIETQLKLLRFLRQRLMAD